ncbi:MAG: hypothetical protein ACHQD9_08470 [Chitinophagales bacterium]
MFATPIKRCSCLLLFITAISFPRFTYSQVNLIGKWNVTCAVEKISEEAVMVCDICPKVTDAKTSLGIGDLSFVFAKDSLTISKEQEKKKAIVKYTLLDKLQKLKFDYEGTAYSFSILVTEPGEYLLKEEKSNCILEMKKVVKK